MTGPVATLPAGTPADDGGTAGTEHRPTSLARPSATRGEAGPHAAASADAQPTGNHAGEAIDLLTASPVETPIVQDVPAPADEIVQAQAGAPRAAEELGLGDRYRYLSGASGKRYLFSGIDLDALEDFRNAVVVIGLGEGASDGGHARRVWIGEIDRDGVRRGPALPRALSRAAEEARGAVLVHLLAGRAAERREALEDLAAGLARAGLETLIA